MKPCVRCLSKSLERKRAGADRSYCIIQCLDCGFNVTAHSFKHAEADWNGFKVWTIADTKGAAA